MRDLEELRRNIERRAREAKPRGQVDEQRSPLAGTNTQVANPKVIDITGQALPGFPAPV